MGDIYTNPPQSRNEAILRATIDGTKYEAPPQSRMEDLLVELKAAIEQGCGIGSYNDLNNKPQINGVTLQGDKSISDLFDGKVDIGVGTVEESGYAELKDENGDMIFRASSANGGASVESGALIGQPGALVLYNGEGGLSSVRPKGGVSLVDVDLPAENGTLALDSQIASSQTPAKAAVVTVPDAAPINAEDITVDITPVQDLHGYDKPWSGGAGKNKINCNAPTVTNNGVTVTNNGDGTFTVTGTSTAQTDFHLTSNGSSVLAPLGDITDGYLVTGCPNGGGTSSYQLVIGSWNYRYATDSGNGDTLTNVGQDGIRVVLRVYSNYSFPTGGLTFKPMIRASGTSADFAPYSNICPIEGWTGAELTQKDAVTNPTVTRTYSTDFGETVYGGVLDVVSGVMTVTHGYVDLGTLDWTINTDYTNPFFLAGLSDKKFSSEDLVCSIYVYGKLMTGTTALNTISNLTINAGRNSNALFIRDDSYTDAATFKTAMNGVQLVYELATPLTIQLTPQQIQLLQGINTVSADCGDTQLKYQPDNVIGELKGMIHEVESELDKLDKAYMTSDTFSERGIDGEYQITRIGNEIHVAAVIDDASIATQTGSVDLIADLPDEFKCDPSYGAVLALRHSSGTGKIEFKLHPGITQSFYMYVEEVNTTSGVWFPIYDVPGKAL